MGMIFLKRDWTSDKNKIEDIFRALKTTRIPVWIVSYLEGTRITKKKLADVRVIGLKCFLKCTASSFRFHRVKHSPKSEDYQS